MTETNFENEGFNHFSNQENTLLNKNFDPDENFFDKNYFSKVNAQYYSLDELQENRITRGNNSLDELQENRITGDNKSFSILHVNIRSLKRH